MTTWDILKKDTGGVAQHPQPGRRGKKNDLLRGAWRIASWPVLPPFWRENCRDMEEARGTISDVMLDRLYLDEKRLAGMAEGIRALTALPDHTGRILSQDHPAQRHDHLQKSSRCPWASSPLSMRAVPTSPPMRRRWP